MLVRVLSVVLGTAALAGAQDLLFSVAAALPGSPPIQAEEIFRAPPGGGSVPFVPTEALCAMFGDRNGNGRYDDPPTNLDALSVRGPGGVTQWLFSTSATTALPGPGVLRDGDIFAFDGQGGLNIVYSEDLFATVTQTNSIDVDAFAEGSSGEIWFSLAEDETTQSPALTAQNGGNPILDEQTVFRLDPGAAEAMIELTKAQVVQVFNAALGTNASSTVDVTGIARDPTNAGALLLTCASSSSAMRGRIVSTTMGGAPFAIAGLPANPTNLGLPATASLDALALTAEPPHPILRALPAEGSSSTGGPGLLLVSGVWSGPYVQLGVANPTFPAPTAWTVTGATGWTTISTDPADPILWQSLAVLAWRLPVNINGEAQYAFDFQGLPPGTSAVLQTTVIGGGALSSPGVVTILP